MIVNVGQTKVMVFERGESVIECNIPMEGEKVEQVKEFVYLGDLFTNDGTYDRDIEKRVNAGNKEIGTLLAVKNNKAILSKVIASHCKHAWLFIMGF
ncbi:hypothetical protein EVAR_49136_1 [Eumeta japonica]|uniref:Uncharacterized protein n=1 Tax=Eumeta variegata TaxID=151549 RepID=A0A4C1Z8V5_EUMVA|nr:hypothetical protein EVAR_49136_1 [Eumeta japonica]